MHSISTRMISDQRFNKNLYLGQIFFILNAAIVFAIVAQLPRKQNSEVYTQWVYSIML